MTPYDKKRNDNNDSHTWQQIQQQFDETQPTEQQPLRAMLKNFADDLENHPYVQKKTTRPQTASVQWPVFLCRFTFGAGSIAAIVLITVFVFLGNPTPSWAQISEQFARSEFLSASIYFKEDGLSVPRHIELWMGRGGRVRVRVENQLIFGEKGEVVAAFDLKTKKQVEADGMAAAILKMLGVEETFSMNTILKGITGGKIVDKTPILNPNAAISADWVVYDMDSGDDGNPQWFRIWALKKSKLPVRIRMWDPRDAEMVDMVLDYSKPQPDIFFDPKAFAAALSTIWTDQLNLAYLHLKDPGGKTYAPGVKDDNALMSLVTATIDGEPFSLSDYADKNVVLLFWDSSEQGFIFQWLKEISEKYKNDNLKIVTVAMHKNAESARQQIKDYDLPFTVLHEPGKGFDNSLARATGFKRGTELRLITDGKAHRINSHQHEMIDLVCRGLNAENSSRLNKLIKFNETTKDRMVELCGEPHEKRTENDTELWIYKFISADKLYRHSVSIRFNKDEKYTGFSSSGSLINPSHISIEISEKVWQEKVVTTIGKKNMPDANSDYHIEIWLKSDKGSPIIGGGHPRTEIAADTTYHRQVSPGVYQPTIALMNHNNTYSVVKEFALSDGISVGDNESVSIRFETAEPVIERSEYLPKPKDNTRLALDRLLEKPDYKQMLKEAYANRDKYDDPKYLPWQLHLKEVAKRYENRPLPETMELFEKGTDESYQFIMRPMNLSGHKGYSMRAIEGDLKTGYACQTLGAGRLLWTADVPSVKMNHDLVYRDETDPKMHYRFLLEQMGYRLETKTVERRVFVAKYDGRELPDSESVSAPNPGGWGYNTVRELLDMMTISLDRQTLEVSGDGPLFIDETGLPSVWETLEELKENAICMEMPSVDSIEDFEKIRSWYEKNFGITFTEETRPIEMFVVRKK